MCCTPNLSDPDHESEHFPPDLMALALLDTGVIPGWSSSRPNLVVQYQGDVPSSWSPFQMTFKIPGLTRIPKIPFLVCFGADSRIQRSDWAAIGGNEVALVFVAVKCALLPVGPSATCRP